MNELKKLCKKQGWGKHDLSKLLPSHPSPETTNKWLLTNHPTNILPTAYLLLRYIAKYGVID